MIRRRGTLAHRLGALLLALLVVLLASTTLLPGDASAQATPEVTLKLDADDVEVGESITISLTAMTDSGAAQPADPTLRVPASFRITGPVISTQTQLSIVNGHASQRTGIRATWQVLPSKAGAFEIGPVTLTVGGRKMTGGQAKVTVRAAGTGRRPRARTDPFGGLFPFGGMPDLDDLHPPAVEAQADPILGMDAPLEPQAFVRAIVDKPRVVVGEQVTLSVYLYTQPRVYQILDPHEPVAADFFQRVLTGGESELRSVAIGGTRWNAQLIRRVALFSLHAGDLAIGPMTVTLVGSGLRGAGMRGGLVRASKPLTVQAVEPPAAGRPTGYALGDVGSYTLSASVDPRTVEAGGSVAVSALLRGTGNIPTVLRLPEQRGAQWLEPEMRESIDTTGTAVTGTRTFTYIVKLSEPGSVDLGAITLPYFDPKTQSYQVARASLGVVQVTGTAPAVEATSARDPFVAVGGPRTTLGAYVAARPPLTDSPWFWALLGGGPLSVLALEGLTRGLRAARSARAERKDAAATRIKDALSEASAAEAAKDGKKAASAVERAVVIAVEAATGVKLRGLLREEVQPALEREGLPAADAEEVSGVLRACDAWRFLPGESPVDQEHPVRRAAALAKRLAAWRRS